MVWEPRKNRRTEGWRFDKDLHFQYWGELKGRPESQGPIMDTMSFIGACWFMERARWIEIEGLDEEHGSWGQVGTEISCKSWLSGGRLVTNKNTWYAHLFRTQGGDFSFPYSISGKQTDHARKYSNELWKENKWDKAIYPLSWLVQKFWPVPGWSQEDLKKIEVDWPNLIESTDGSQSIIFYTDNQLNLKIAHAVQKQLKSVGLPIVSTSLKPMSFGTNICLAPLKRGYMTMFKQILMALEKAQSKYVFFCEHDVLYHESHFDFVPPKDDVWYYNVNMWKVDASNGHALKTRDCKQVSGICVNRSTAIKHYQARIKKLEEFDEKYGEVGFNAFVRAVGFEPGTHHRDERVDDATSESWESAFPNLDIRHEANLTPTRWSPDQFRNKKYTEGWEEDHVSHLPGWNLDQLKFLKLQ